MKKSSTIKKGKGKNNNSSSLKYEPQVVTLSQAVQTKEMEQVVELRARNMLPSFMVSAELAKSINMHILKGNEKEGVFFGTSHTEGLRPITYLLDFLNITQSAEEQNIRSKITLEECACATFSIVKGNSWKMQKFRHQVQCCQELLPEMPQAEHEDGQLSDLLEKLFLQLFRVGLLLQTSQQSVLNRYVFFPNINLRIRQIAMRCKYVASPVLSQVMKPIDSSQPFFANYGFIMPDDKGRFMLLEREENHFENMPRVGAWIHAKNLIIRETGAINPQKVHLIWSVIVNYIRSPIFQKVSMFGAYRGLLIIFTPGEKRPLTFTFQCQQDPSLNRWAFAKSTNRKMDLKQQIIFDTVMEHTDIDQLLKHEQDQINQIRKMQKQPGLKKHISSPVRKEVKQPVPKRQFPSFSNNSFARSENDSRSLKEVCSSDKVSQKSYDERDLEIRVLKEKLQFYKSRCQDLEKSVLNYKANYQQLLSMYQMMPLMGHPPSLSHLGMVGMPSQPQHYYPPLYHSAVMHQPFLQQYASAPMSNQNQQNTVNPMAASVSSQMPPIITQLPTQVSMTQSYAFSREQDELRKDQQTLMDSAFTKKQHIVEPSISEYKTPAQKVPTVVQASGNLVRVNLADQFSDGVTSPDSVKNDENINTANLKPVSREDMIENSPKFVLADISDLDNSKIQNNFHDTSYQDNLQLSFKGYAVSVSAPVAPLAPMSQPTSNNSIPSTSSSTSIKQPTFIKDSLKEPKYRVNLMDSYASDNEYRFTSELIKDKPKVDRCVDSDSDNQELVSKISRRYFPRA